MKPGTVVDQRFEIVRLAGAGGMGTVYECLDRASGARVALKVVRFSDPSHEERFEREARVLSNLSHPAIVAYVHHGRTEDGSPYLAMEWLEGMDLARRLRQGPLAPRDAVRIAEQVADALAPAHALGVVHRDVKPENVFLVGGAASAVKLLDFGLARAGDAASLTRSAILGTPAYMAPEQTRTGRFVDARADVFSLGCVLYECLVGAPPFSGENAYAILAKLAFEEAPRVREGAPDVPASLDAVVARMLAKEPSERLPDGAAVARELRALDWDAPADASATALTAGEQELVAVVLAAPPPRAPDGPSGPASARPGARDAEEALATLAQAYRARIRTLFDGSIAALLSRAGAATDLAAAAAECALAVRALLRDRPIALAFGRVARGASRVAVGDAIDRASALLRAGGAPGVISVDDLTADLLDARFEIRREAGVAELVAQHPSNDPVRKLLGKATPFVGRERELGAIEPLAAECFEERAARCVLVTAPAGAGKSRLRVELARRLAALGAGEAWLGRGDAMRAGSAFAVLGGAVRVAAAIEPDDPVDVKRAKLRARIARRVAPEAQARVAAFVGEIAGVPFPDEDDVPLRAARGDARLMNDQTLRAWLDWLAAETAAGPVVLALEDLHWGDAPTVRYVDAALRASKGAPLFVAAFARPEVHDAFPKLWADRGLVELRLAELSRRACERLARDTLGDRATPDVVARIAERCGGNAFHLEELIRAAAAGRGDEIPATAIAMVQARLEALEPAARRVLRAASVFGERFSEPGVRALLGAEGQEDAAAWIGVLVERELVTRRDDARFAFAHAIVREAAYGMLTGEDRALGHRLAAEWLESAGEGDARELAEHFERGEAMARAARCWERGAEKALAANDLSGVFACVARGVACDPPPFVRGALSLRAAEARRWQGDMAATLTLALAALASLPPGDDLWFAAVGELAEAAAMRGDRDALRPVLPDLARLAAAPWGGGPARGRAALVAAASVLHALIILGAHEEARAIAPLIDRDFDALAAEDPWAAAAVARGHVAGALLRGDPSARAAWGERVTALVERTGDVRRACQERGRVGYYFMDLGAYERAVALLREVLAQARALGLTDVEARAQHNLGLALARVGEVDEGRAHERAAADAFHARGNRRMEGASYEYLALIAMSGGAWADAEAAAREALRLGTDPEPLPLNQAESLAILARALLAQGRAAEALDAAREGLRILESLDGTDEGESLIRLAYAEALAATGDHAAARDAIGSAERRLLARADRITDGAARASFLERVPENARTLELVREARQKP